VNVCSEGHFNFYWFDHWIDNRISVLLNEGFDSEDVVTMVADEAVQLPEIDLLTILMERAENLLDTLYPEPEVQLGWIKDAFIEMLYEWNLDPVYIEKVKSIPIDFKKHFWLASGALGDLIIISLCDSLMPVCSCFGGFDRDAYEAGFVQTIGHEYGHCMDYLRNVKRGTSLEREIFAESVATIFLEKAGVVFYEGQRKECEQIWAKRRAQLEHIDDGLLSAVFNEMTKSFRGGVDIKKFHYFFRKAETYSVAIYGKWAKQDFEAMLAELHSKSEIIRMLEGPYKKNPSPDEIAAEALELIKSGVLSQDQLRQLILESMKVLTPSRTWASTGEPVDPRDLAAEQMILSPFWAMVQKLPLIMGYPETLDDYTTEQCLNYILDDLRSDWSTYMFQSLATKIFELVDKCSFNAFLNEEVTFDIYKIHLYIRLDDNLKSEIWVLPPEYEIVHAANFLYLHDRGYCILRSSKIPELIPIIAEFAEFFRQDLEAQPSSGPGRTIALSRSQLKKPYGRISWHPSV
jgi:hypothetical protein